MPNFVFIATSIDGYIAKTDGSLDWLFEVPNPDGSDFGYNNFVKDIGAILMGRITFEKVLTFDNWPYNKPVFVISNSLKQIDKKLSGKVEIVGGELRSIINKLNERGIKNIYIDGGMTITNFLKDDLIDEMIITRIPVLLGDGIPLFNKFDIELKFDHVKTEVFNNALVQSHYKRIRN